MQYEISLKLKMTTINKPMKIWLGSKSILSFSPTVLTSINISSGRLCIILILEKN